MSIRFVLVNKQLHLRQLKDNIVRAPLGFQPKSHNHNKKMWETGIWYISIHEVSTFVPQKQLSKEKSFLDETLQHLLGKRLDEQVFLNLSSDKADIFWGRGGSWWMDGPSSGLLCPPTYTLFLSLPKPNFLLLFASWILPPAQLGWPSLGRLNTKLCLALPFCYPLYRL